MPEDTTTPAAPAATPPAAAPPAQAAAPAAAPPAQPPAPAAAKPADVPEGEVAAFLAPRLAEARSRERASVLKELGISDPAQAKETLEAAAKATEEAKSAGEKLGETNVANAALKKQNEQLLKFNEDRSGRLMDGLDDAQKENIKGAITAAGGDPASPLALLSMIEHMAPQWAAAQTSAAPAAAKDGPATPAAGTAPPNGAPAEHQPTPVNHVETHATLEKTNPFAAARFGLEHATEVFPTKTD